MSRYLDGKLDPGYWWIVSGFFPKWLRKVVPCPYCDGRDDGCDCGASDIGWEITGGAHYQSCMQYNGCPRCGR